MNLMIVPGCSNCLYLYPKIVRSIGNQNICLVSVVKYG